MSVRLRFLFLFVSVLILIMRKFTNPNPLWLKPSNISIKRRRTVRTEINPLLRGKFKPIHTPYVPANANLRYQNNPCTQKNIHVGDAKDFHLEGFHCCNELFLFGLHPFSIFPSLAHTPRVTMCNFQQQPTVCCTRRLPSSFVLFAHCLWKIPCSQTPKHNVNEQ